MHISEEAKAFVLLNFAGFPKNKIEVLRKTVCPLRTLLSLDAASLRGVSFLEAADSAKIISVRESAPFRKEIEDIVHSSCSVLTLGDASYPALLKEIYSPPPVLYVRGNPQSLSGFSVAMVGSRRASSYGVAVAERFAYKLGLYGVTVVSGFARGIDTASCRGALNARGKTIAVLGSGVYNIYPKENEPLIEKIIEYEGAVVSEFPLHTAPLAAHFPRRNRIISGLSRAVVVVEAARKSGALITASCALEQNRDVFAIPGNITTPLSEGTHALIKEGACLVRSPEEILEELRYSFVPPAHGRAGEDSRFSEEALTPEEKLLYTILDTERSVEEIAGLCSLDIRRILQVLFTLRNRNIIKELPGKIYSRR